MISWEFKTKVDFKTRIVNATQFYDIGFAVQYLGVAQNLKKEMVPMQRHDAFKRVITGTLEIKEKGFYKLVWDNSFSWTRGKMIKFNVYKGTEVLTS